MGSEELRELHHSSHEGREDRSLAPVSFTMAVLAVVVAATSLLGHRAHTEEVLVQTRVTDAWAYYQAKDTRFHTAQMFADLAAIVAPANAGAAAKLRVQYQRDAERYNAQKNDRSTEAKKMEAEMTGVHQSADRYDFGEALVEVALVASSITLLTRIRLFWRLGILIGLAGTCVAITGLFAR